MPEIEGAVTVVIFGASGDLTQRKLVPALFQLFCKGRIPPSLRVVGVALTDWDDQAFRSRMREGVERYHAEAVDEARWEAFAARLFYLEADFTEPTAYARLEEQIRELEREECHRLYYLAVPPRFFPVIIAHLGAAGMVDERGAGWRRVVIEKPFGKDLETAMALNQEVHQVLAEHQIYRIDHYLAKETVQNILVFRFGNTMFEPVWNRNYIDHVQITVAEEVDVGHRAGYYDQAGVLRDMFQNHLMQLLALVSMEPPASFDADALRNEKVKVLSSVRPMSAAEIAARTVRAQYEGYRDAPDVADGSETPTYAALELYIDNWRWQGVPFYLRSGKALRQKATEIIIVFKEPPHLLLPIPMGESIRSNVLALCLQPHEGIHLRFEAKVPDTEAQMRAVLMDFHYAEGFEGVDLPEAYETLLLNAIDGDATLFTRADGIEAAWRIIDPILIHWDHEPEPALVTYPPNAWGPDAAAALLARTGREWRHDCGAH